VLISCPSCGKRISDRIPVCPSCKALNPSAFEESSPDDAALTLPYVEPDPEEAGPAPPIVPEPRIPFRSEDDPTATLPPSPALFSRFATATLPPPAPPPQPKHVEAAPVPSPTEPQQAKKTVINSGSLALEATEHLNAGRFADALATIDRLLSTEPRNGDALHTRAQALFKLGRRPDAARAIVKALEAAPDSLAFWHYKAVMEHEEDKPKDACRSAIDLVEIAQQTETESPLVEEGRLMIADFEATGAYPSVRGYLALLGLGCASMKAGRPEAALGFFDRVIDAASDNPDGFRWKGKALMQLDQTDEALVLFDAALEVAPNDPEVHYERGMAFAILGDFERAIEAFDATLAIDPHHAAAIRERRDLKD
jgi:tetratricopeptide (TPR) repeat protein